MSASSTLQRNPPTFVDPSLVAHLASVEAARVAEDARLARKRETRTDGGAFVGGFQRSKIIAQEKDGKMIAEENRDVAAVDDDGVAAIAAGDDASPASTGPNAPRKVALGMSRSGGGAGGGGGGGDSPCGAVERAATGLSTDAPCRSGAMEPVASALEFDVEQAAAFCAADAEAARFAAAAAADDDYEGGAGACVAASAVLGSSWGPSRTLRRSRLVGLTGAVRVLDDIFDGDDDGCGDMEGDYGGSENGDVEDDESVGGVGGGGGGPAAGSDGSDGDEFVRDMLSSSARAAPARVRAPRTLPSLQSRVARALDFSGADTTASSVDETAMSATSALSDTTGGGFSSSQPWASDAPPNSQSSTTSATTGNLLVTAATTAPQPGLPPPPLVIAAPTFAFSGAGATARSLTLQQPPPPPSARKHTRDYLRAESSHSTYARALGGAAAVLGGGGGGVSPGDTAAPDVSNALRALGAVAATPARVGIARARRNVQKGGGAAGGRAGGSHAFTFASLSLSGVGASGGNSGSSGGRGVAAPQGAGTAFVPPPTLPALMLGGGARLTGRTRRCARHRRPFLRTRPFRRRQTAGRRTRNGRTLPRPRHRGATRIWRLRAAGLDSSQRRRTRRLRALLTPLAPMPRARSISSPRMKMNRRSMRPRALVGESVSA